MRHSFAIIVIAVLGQFSAAYAAEALRIDADFSVSSSGAALYSIPLVTPPGIGVLQARASLEYNSQAGNGLLGVGWNVAGLSAITRCARTVSQDGAAGPISLTANDKFCLDGQRLRLVSGTYGGASSIYQTELETYSKVTALGTAGNGPQKFEVKARNGLTYEYGSTADSRIEAGGGATSTVLTWALSTIRDRSGNEIRYHYTEDQTTRSYRIDRIEYPHLNGGGGPYYQVSFEYEDRPSEDQPRSYPAGYASTLLKRMKAITVSHWDSGWLPIRAYGLGYELGPQTNNSRIYQVTECAGSDCKAPTVIDYQDGEDSWDNEVSAGFSVASMETALPIDFNGDGLNDLIYHNSSTNTYWVTLATGSGFGSATNTGASSVNHASALPLDFNDDGKMDVLIPYSGSPCSVASCWRLLTSNGATFSSTNLTIPADGAGGNAEIADFDGDGKPDLVYGVQVGTSSSQLLGRTNTGTSFSSSVTNLWQGNCLFRLESPAFGHPQNRFRGNKEATDLNGDGLDDVLAAIKVTYSCRPEYPNPPSPYKAWGIYLSTGGALDLSDHVSRDDNQPMVADVNGDRYADIVYAPASGSTWSIRFGTEAGFMANATTTATLGNIVNARLADCDGDGTADLVSSVSGTYQCGAWNGSDLASSSLGIADSTAVQYLKVIDIDGDDFSDWLYVDASNNVRYRFNSDTGERPDVASSFTDGFGINHSPQYISIAQGSYTAGAAVTYPYRQVRRGPYVVATVTSSTASASGSYTRTYHYTGVVTHAEGRGSMGFASVRMHDGRDNTYHHDFFSQTFPAAGTVTKTEWRQSNDTTLIARQTNTPATKSYGSGYNSRFFVYIETSVNEDMMTAVKTTTSSTFDDHGNITLQSIARRDEDPNSPWYTTSYTETVDRDVYPSESMWCLNIPERIEVTRSETGGGSATRVVAQAVDYAKCRITSETIEPDSNVLKVHTSFDFDGCGNRSMATVTGRKPDGSAMPARISEWRYGARCQFPEEIENALDEVTTVEYDRRFGFPTTITDPNGLVSETTYDAWGREDVKAFPDGTSLKLGYSDCSVSGNYCGSGNSFVRWWREVKLRTTGAQTIRTDGSGFDAKNRLVHEATQLATSAMSRRNVAYDIKGRAVSETVPSTGGYVGERKANRDLIGRPHANLLTVGINPHSGETYDYAGRKVSTYTVPDGRLTERYYDVRGLLRRVWDESTAATTSYEYNPFGELVEVNDADQHAVVQVRNDRGFVTQLTDPDRGTRTFSYNSLGEMVEQTDAKSQTMAVQYDGLSRPTQRIDHSDGTTTWTWGSSAAAKEIGRLKSVSGPGYSETYTYNSHGKRSTLTVAADATYLINYDYDSATGLPDTITYPTSTSSYRLKVQFDYTNGLLTGVSDYNQPSTVYWQQNAVDARGLALDEALGNGIGVITSFDPLTGLMESRTAGSNGMFDDVQNLTFNWNDNGTLHQRIDGNQSNLTETFYYDGLNRLDYSERNQVTNFDVSYGDDGNISYMSTTGTYSYEPGRPHAVSKVSIPVACDVVEYLYGYDANGNMTSRNGDSITWYSYDLPKKITSGFSYSEFSYTPNRSRWKQVASYNGTAETTIYIGGLLEKVTRGGVTEYRHRIPAGSSTNVIYTRRSSGTPSTSTYYITQDHLGSSTAVMDESGGVLANLSFSSFGRRQGSTWAGAPSSAEMAVIAQTTRQGFTGHEHLDAVDLVHMNGRVYDPGLGRFLSPDPVRLASPEYSQTFNPYSYVLNSPLSLVDPTGFTEEIVVTAPLPKPPKWPDPSEDEWALTYADDLTCTYYICIDWTLDEFLDAVKQMHSGWLRWLEAQENWVPPKENTCGGTSTMAAAATIIEMISGNYINTDFERSLVMNFLSHGPDVELNAQQMTAIRSAVAADFLRSASGSNWVNLVGSPSLTSNPGVETRPIYLGKWSRSEYDGGLGTVTGTFRGGNMLSVSDTFNFDPKPWGARGGGFRGYITEAGVRAAGVVADSLCNSPPGFGITGR